MPRTYLWIDDDGPDRFLYEEYRLREAGWTATWAENIHDAVHALANTPYSAMILDQMLPVEGLRNAQPFAERLGWGGAALLYWLRGEPLPPNCPAEVNEILAPHFATPPLADNRQIPVVCLSAYANPEVRIALERMSAGPPLQLAKPVNDTALIAFFQQIAEARG
jgi:CheY-like chemotaxis protein